MRRYARSPSAPSLPTCFASLFPSQPTASFTRNQYNATGIREEVLDAKGLRQEGPKVHVFSFEGMDLDRLKALAERRGAPALEEGRKVVDVQLAPSPEKEP